MENLEKKVVEDLREIDDKLKALNIKFLNDQTFKSLSEIHDEYRAQIDELDKAGVIYDTYTGDEDELLLEKLELAEKLIKESKKHRRLSKTRDLENRAYTEVEAVVSSMSEDITFIIEQLELEG